jgi:hypothetical protein
VCSWVDFGAIFAGYAGLGDLFCPMHNLIWGLWRDGLLDVW